MADDKELITAVWARLIALADKLGAAPLNKWPACWYLAIDDRWEIAVNAHKETMGCDFRDGSHDVPPFTVLVAFNGWPAGMIDPFGLTLAAGQAANVQTFCEALDRRIAA